MPLLCVVSGVHACGSMETSNHVVGIWQTQGLDVERDRSYPLCRENLDFTCGTEVQFDEMKYDIALIPSKYSVSMAYQNSVLLLASSDLVPSELFVTNNRKKRKRKKSNKI